MVTEDKFRSSLAILGIHITENDIQKLLVRYKATLPGLFSYTEFCKSIDDQFYDEQSARNNLKAIESHSVHPHLPPATTATA